MGDRQSVSQQAKDVREGGAGAGGGGWAVTGWASTGMGSPGGGGSSAGAADSAGGGGGSPALSIQGSREAPYTAVGKHVRQTHARCMGCTLRGLNVRDHS